MRLLFVNSFYSPDIGGGAEVTLKTIAEELGKRGHEIHVATTGPADEVTTVNNVKVYRFEIANAFWHFKNRPNSAFKRLLWHIRDRYNKKMLAKLEQLIEQLNPDCIIYHNISGFSASVWNARTKPGVQKLQVLHDYYNICPGTNMFGNGKSCEKQCIKCKAFRFEHPSLSKKITTIIGVSNAVLRNHLDRGLFKDARNAIVINNARNLIEPRQRLRYPNSPSKYGYIGSLIPSKGIEVVIEAFLRSEACGTGSLLVAGDGPSTYADQLRTKYGESNVDFVGHIAADEFFSKIDYCVVPSIWREPFAGVVYEAFIHGVPVIGSNTGGTPEMIQDGVNGLLFDPKNTDQLVHIINKTHLDNALWHTLALGAKCCSPQYLDVNHWISQYEHLFQNNEAEKPI